jgi:hypothetical protein
MSGADTSLDPEPAEEPAAREFSREAVARLREEFDASFAAAPPPARERPRDFVFVRVGKLRLALAAGQIQGIEQRSRIVPVPSTVPALLGVTGVRGAIVPVFRMAALPGFTSSSWDLAFAPPDARSANADTHGVLFALVEVAPVRLPGQRAADRSQAIERIGLAFDELLYFAQIAAERIFLTHTDPLWAGSLMHRETPCAILDVAGTVARIVHPISGPANSPAPPDRSPAAPAAADGDSTL